jgi:predicted N-acetyltransferase YhbS
MTPHIHNEALQHPESIRQVNRLAFGRENEACLVDALRSGNHARISLVTEVNGVVAGHILFSDLPILTNHGIVPALAPLAVLPKWFKKGSGTVVRSSLRAVPATVPDPLFEPCRNEESAEITKPNRLRDINSTCSLQ